MSESINNERKKKRHSIRLKDYDYSSEGMYFITICVYGRECLFGSVVNGEMVVSRYGKIAENEWRKTEIIRPNIKMDYFVVMPNHIHGIAHICRGVLQYAPTNEFKSPSQTIGAIVRGFKSTITKQINKIRDTADVRLWQRNYYEHIIRDEKYLNSIREYIINNPAKWEYDKYYI
ncbi:MAG: transposase [Candidatus Omnitrophota bacterium]